MQTLQHRLDSLEQKELSIILKNEEAQRRQQKREIALKQIQEVRATQEREVKAMRKQELSKELERRRAKFLQQREGHKKKLSQYFTQAVENKKQLAHSAKKSLSVDLGHTRRLQTEEEKQLRDKVSTIAQTIRSQIKARAVKSTGLVESLRQSYESRLEGTLQEKEQVHSRVTPRQISLMEQKERELLERLKVTQTKYSNPSV